MAETTAAFAGMYNIYRFTDVTPVTGRSTATEELEILESAPSYRPTPGQKIDGMPPFHDSSDLPETSTSFYYYNDDDDCIYVNETTNQTVYNPDCYYSYEDYELEIFPFETYILGRLQPVLIFLTAVTNIFVVGFFMTKKNKRKATDLLFISIAFSDTLTGLTLIPNSIHVYAADNPYLTAAWCNAYMILRFYVSRVFHTVSVWQTVVLGVQRYLCVCHPFISGRICTFWKTFVSIVVMYCCAIVLHTYHLTDNKLLLWQCKWATEYPCVDSCVYLWFCLVLQHIAPCLLLSVLTVITLRELKRARKRVSSISGIPKNSMRSTRDRVITITATLIVVCFLIPELPHGLYKFVFVVNKHTNIHLTKETNHIIICAYEIALILSFNANFWIYCVMMHDFRHKLLTVLTCGTFKQCAPRLRSPSVSTRSGSLTTALSRTNSIASHNRVLSRSTSVHSTASDNIHSVVIPLSPTRGYDQIKFTDSCTEHSELKLADCDPNDDVFV